jgi:hypothetical protein
VQAAVGGSPVRPSPKSASPGELTRWHHCGVSDVLSALGDGKKLPRRLQVSGGGPWFLAGPGSFRRVGAGDLSAADLHAVHAELGERVLVAMPAPRSLQQYLGAKANWGMRRVRRYERLIANVPPSVAAVARGAQVAVLPDLGPVWVDNQHLFRAGDTATLPWTEPVVSLVVVKPRRVRDAIRGVIGPKGPKRATLVADG